MSLSFDLNAHHYKNNSNSQYSQITNLLSNINIEKNSYILDVGCGYGKIIATLSQKAHKGISIGIDPSKNMINLALKTLDLLQKIGKLINLAGINRKHGVIDETNII